jgi:hypothetical protein
MLASKVRDFVPFSAEISSKLDPTCQFRVAASGRRRTGRICREKSPPRVRRNVYELRSGARRGGRVDRGPPSPRGSRSGGRSASSVGVGCTVRWRSLRFPPLGTDPRSQLCKCRDPRRWTPLGIDPTAGSQKGSQRCIGEGQVDSSLRSYVRLTSRTLCPSSSSRSTSHLSRCDTLAIRVSSRVTLPPADPGEGQRQRP